MVLAIGVVIAQSATRFSALALDGPSRQIRRSHAEAPLSPAEASATITRLIQEIQKEVGAANSPEGAICCALEADLDADLTPTWTPSVNALSACATRLDGRT